MHERIGDGVTQIDTLLKGWTRMTAGYLIEGPAPVLVETGSQTSLATLLGELAELGVGPSDLAGVAVTHIHLDHAGAVGDVARAFPKATVYVQEHGARHLVDPSRLVGSALRVWGDLLDQLYGRITPTDAARIKVLNDGDRIEIGPDHWLDAIYSPGHAKHHVGLLDSNTGVLFVGDAVGVRLPDAGVLRPSTPPPDFDLETAIDSLHKFAARQPTGVALAHFGLIDTPQEILLEGEEILRKWADVAERAWREGRDIAEALDAAFSGAIAHVDPANREKVETLNGVHSNAAGFRRWLERRHSHGHDHSGTAAHAPGLDHTHGGEASESVDG